MTQPLFAKIADYSRSYGLAATVDSGWRNLALLRQSYWAYLPDARERARRWPTLSPSVLVLSLPRSGSSWVGDVLGSGEALYLREPVTQSYRREVPGTATVIPIDAQSPDPVYKRFADLAFAGIPRFTASIVDAADNWSLDARTGRRLVIKEVNPLACAWYIEAYRPRIVFLLRHPAAVALSYRKLGWEQLDQDRTVAWEAFGRRQSFALREAHRALSVYDDKCFVDYDDLCRNPVEGFRALFGFAGLTLSSAIENGIRRRSAGGDRSDTYGTSRDSASMIDSWRKRVAEPELRALRAGFASYDLPWFQDDRRW
ncbi:MAG: sulfotransferase [Geminicoccaceae bacterium]